MIRLNTISDIPPIPSLIFTGCGGGGGGEVWNFGLNFRLQSSYFRKGASIASETL